MERLRNWFYASVQRVDTAFRRYLWDEINWSSRLIVITGARGIGKTTFLRQYIAADDMDFAIGHIKCHSGFLGFCTKDVFEIGYIPSFS